MIERSTLIELGLTKLRINQLGQAHFVYGMDSRGNLILVGVCGFGAPAIKIENKK